MKYGEIKDWHDACRAANDVYGCDEKADGNPEESFTAGWVNAADMIEDGELDQEDSEKVLYFVFFEFDNMGHSRDQEVVIGSCT